MSLSTTFTRLLRAALTSEQWAELCAKNAELLADEGPDGVCASGDYLDSNCVMAEAWMEVHGRAPEVNLEQDRRVWNAAWDEARRTWCPGWVSEHSFTRAEAEVMGAPVHPEALAVFLTKWADRSGWWAVLADAAGTCWAQCSNEDEVFTSAEQCRAWLWARVEETNTVL